MQIKKINFIINISLINIIFSFISIPLKIYNENNIENIILSSNELKDNDLKVILYNEISIGEPKQKIIFIISPNEYNFYMVLNIDKETKNNSYYYDIRKSNSTNIYFGENEVGAEANVYFMKEKFYFKFENITNNNVKEIGISNIDLVLYLRRPKLYRDYNFSDFNSYMIFGLKLCESMDRIEYVLNLIRQLKKHNITNNYKWFIDYSTRKNQFNDDLEPYEDIKMIIGADPHEVYQNEYNANDLKLVNAKSNQGIIFWGLKFDKIYYYKNEKYKDNILFELNNNININTTNFEEFLTGEINHDLFFISSPKEYFYSINKDFFNKLIIEKKCFMIGEKYKIIYCSKNAENERYLKNNFKTLFFKHHEYNYIFELKYEDLFLNYNEKILFLIIYENNNKKWKLGIPFLKKYLLTYDYDFKVIGFYGKDNDKKEKAIKNYNTKIFIIILLLLTCLIFGFFLSKKIYNLGRKKRVNEIEDNYYYKEKNIPYNNHRKNEDINKDDKHKSLIGLEMGKFV